ncbi:AbrB family transcriptional regulator [Rhizobium sp. L1K21]|uniref:AbrB family transcriptional regulator n=1 Tax=Rhizobium sp. L1K21 TaxID=2954933 RepID=UPI002093E4A2|nr:AbrB family transcriptional regulator [Rhizobium sp. L1K21]MCO6188351.1 AbrB family transcriptional regulator [Rhizobium sp. L1K21]
MSRNILPVLITLAAALSGGAVFQFLGVPAGPLVGSTLAVTLLAAFGFKLVVPALLRNLGFTTIGVSLGAGITPHFLSDLMRFPASLTGLTITVMLVMLSSGFVLNRFFGATRATATLATTPGALSYTLSLATERRHDTDLTFVMVLQCMRLFVLTIFLPPAIAMIEHAAGATAKVSAPHTLDMPTSLILIAVAGVAGFLFERARIPAAYILASMALSGIAHGAGMVEGRPAAALTFIGFALAGAVIGARFSAVSAAQVRRLFKAGLAMSVLALTISALVSLVFARLLALPFGQVWVSFAPGGVEGMSAMALSLGYDPAYVATHHIFRLVLILIMLPIVLRWVAPRKV